LHARLQAHAWCGQIVGPHGTGKSTLLAHLLPRLRTWGRVPVHVLLHTGDRRLPASAQAILDTAGANVWVIDGFEQLWWWNRWRLARQARQRCVGLIVTAHRSLGWPTLYTTTVDAALAQTIAAELLATTPDTVTAAEVGPHLHARCGNLRAALFDLYDDYERRRRAPPSGAR
jgi:hypothetical protein